MNSIGIEFEDGDLEVLADISKEALVEAFCQYVEDDYYEWLKDNFKSFFNHGNPDWDWIKQKIKANEQQADCQGIPGYC